MKKFQLIGSAPRWEYRGRNPYRDEHRKLQFPSYDMKLTDVYIDLSTFTDIHIPMHFSRQHNSQVCGVFAYFRDYRQDWENSYNFFENRYETFSDAMEALETEVFPYIKDHATFLLQEIDER